MYRRRSTPLDLLSALLCPLWHAPGLDEMKEGERERETKTDRDDQTRSPNERGEAPYRRSHRRSGCATSYGRRRTDTFNDNRQQVNPAIVICRQRREAHRLPSGRSCPASAVAATSVLGFVEGFACVASSSFVALARDEI